MMVRFLLFSFLLLLGCAPYRVQTVPFTLAKGESLRGRVVDPTGAVIARVQVEVWKENTLVAASISDEEGQYRLEPNFQADENFTIKIKATPGWCKPELIEGSPSLPGSRDIRLGVCSVP
jgi:hypothetical protein